MEMRNLIQRLKSLCAGLAVALYASMLTRAVTWAGPFNFIITAIVVGTATWLLIVGIVLFEVLVYREKVSDYVTTSFGSPSDGVLLLGAVLLIVLAFPAFVVVWQSDVGRWKYGIQVAVFFLSLGTGFLVHRKFPDMLPSVADKVTYFTGVGLGPAGVFQILIPPD